MNQSKATNVAVAVLGACAITGILWLMDAGAAHGAERPPAATQQQEKGKAPPPAPQCGQQCKSTPIDEKVNPDMTFYRCWDGTVVLDPADCPPRDHGGYRASSAKVNRK